MSVTTHPDVGFRGTHFCLGASLARLEANLTLQWVIERVGRITAVPGVTREALPRAFVPVPLVNGLRSLPVSFETR